MLRVTWLLEFSHGICWRRSSVSTYIGQHCTPLPHKLHCEVCQVISTLKTVAAILLEGVSLSVVCSSMPEAAVVQLWECCACCIIRMPMLSYILQERCVFLFAVLWSVQQVHTFAATLPAGLTVFAWNLCFKHSPVKMEMEDNEWRTINILFMGSRPDDVNDFYQFT
jgi:hypothetical protein